METMALPQATRERILSLDILRGFDMFFIMGGDALMAALAAALGYADSVFARQFGHVAWAGLAFEDTIFPLFLFIAGATFPLSLAKQRANGASRSAIARRILRRGLTLVLLGLIYNGLLTFDFAHLRYYGVLQLIGIAWTAAALLRLFTGGRTRVLVAATLLIGTPLLFFFVGAGDFPNAAPFTAEGNLGCWIDRTLVGVAHLHRPLYDPEGAASILSSVVTAILGTFAGDLLESPRPATRKAAMLGGAATLLLATGLILSPVVPLVKNIWTSSFVLVTGGYSAAMLALFYDIFDVRKIRLGATFFRVIGLNAITIYLAQEIVGFQHMTAFLFGGLAALLPDAWGRVAFYLGYVAVCWLFLAVLYRKNIFLKV